MPASVREGAFRQVESIKAQDAEILSQSIHWFTSKKRTSRATSSDSDSEPRRAVLVTRCLDPAPSVSHMLLLTQRFSERVNQSLQLSRVTWLCPSDPCRNLVKASKEYLRGFPRALPKQSQSLPRLRKNIWKLGPQARLPLRGSRKDFERRS